MIRLILRRGHDRRVRAGHPWVFSNEIERFDGEPAPGDAVEIAAAGGEPLGTAYYNPQSLIAARILSRRNESIDTAEFFRQRLTRALAYRQAFYDGKRSLRLVYGESDGLPGLV
ncbi:MAG TPA: rRNA large subunit methyltransferase I, partial [Desulfuromonadales bacterium]|nr:rRNA large subunit methyltransferase I [Desulfuromonadales bacterium]